MSAREMVYSTIEKLTDEQVSALLAFINSMVTPAHGINDISDEEILHKLEEAEEDFKAGRFYSEDEIMSRLEKPADV